MVDFTVEDRGPIQGRVSVKAPVVDTGTLDALGTIKTGMNTLFHIAGNAAKSGKETAANSSTAQFATDLNKLNEGIAQGALTSRQAGTKARAIYNAHVANHPGEAAKAATLFNKIISGEVRTPTSNVDIIDKEQQKLKAEAASLGIINENMSAEELNSTMLNFTSIKRHRESMKDSQQELSLRTAQVGLSKSEISLREAQDKEEAVSFLNAEAKHITLVAGNQITDVQRSFSSDPNVTEEVALAELDQRMNSLVAQVNDTASGAGNEKIKLITGPIEKMFALAAKQVSGGFQKEVIENRLAIQKARITSRLLEDETLADFYGKDQILSNTGLKDIFGSMPAMEAVFKKQIIQGGKVANMWDLSNRNEKMVYDVMKDSVSNPNIEAGDKAEHSSQVDTIFNNMMKATDRFSGDIQGPKEFNTAVDFYATPEFARWVKQGNMNAEDAQGAERVFNELYLQEATPIIEEKWENLALHKFIGDEGVEQTALQSRIGVEWTETGVRFHQLPGETRSFNEAVGRRVNTLNKELGPLVNKLVRAGAHLGGTTDYQKAFDSTFANVFDLEDDQADTGGSLEQFKTKQGETFSKSKGALTDSLQGASSKTKPNADKKMEQTLENEFATLSDNFLTATGKTLNINDAIAKEGTSREGKTPGSRHFHGDALDLSVAGLSDQEKLTLVEMARGAGFTGFGFGDTILHIDKGRSRGWAYGNAKFAGQDVAGLIGNIKDKK